MRPVEKLFHAMSRQIRSVDWDGWYQNKPDQESDRRKDRWRVYCGDGRYDEEKRNAIFAKSNQVALNFQVVGAAEQMTQYEFCLAWPDGWRLMYHWDAKQSAWPHHPEYHIQFESPRTATAPLPPFVDWRLPYQESQPERLLQYLVAQLFATKPL